MSTSGNTILVVEDDRELCTGLAIRLRANRYEAFFATDGATALVEAQRQKPDLILLDLGLPAGDGFVVLSRLKAIPRLAAIPVIVMTARAEPGNQQKVADLGAAAFLQKPFENETLLVTIARLLA
jgi:DNA-binding response OmpR family regulator